MLWAAIGNQPPVNILWLCRSPIHFRLWKPPAMKFRSLIAAAMILLGALHSYAQPLIDYHQHLLSPAAAGLGSLPRPFTARDLIALLDAAGVRRAVVLSLAYQYGNPNKPPVVHEYDRVKEENDWTARQVAEYPGRLRAFCGVDPLKAYA